MNSTQGVMEAINSLFLAIEGQADPAGHFFYGMPAAAFLEKQKTPAAGPFENMAEALRATGTQITAGALYVMQFAVCVNDYITRPGMIDAMLHRPKVFKQLTPAAIHKYAGMDVPAFAQALYNICTDNGQKLTPADDEKNGYKAPIMQDRCLYAAYVYTQVSEYLERIKNTFLPVPMPNGVMQLPWINTGKAEIDEYTKQGTITVGDTVFSVRKNEISTGALMLFLYLLHKSRSIGEASIAIPLREYAEVKKRSTTKQAIQKLKAEIAEQLEELAPLGYDAFSYLKGKTKSTGHILLNGGTHTVENGEIRWNFNQDLYKQLMIYAPTDTPLELFAVNPQTNANTFYFGMYIAQNWRLNEGNMPARRKIPMRTLVEKSPKLPKYEAVRASNGNVSARIIRKAFTDLDALETLNYDFYTAEGARIDNPEALDYQSFINGYILVDYNEYPQHPDRVKKGQEHRKKAQDAKERAQLAAAAKAAVAKAAAKNAQEV